MWLMNGLSMETGLVLDNHGFNWTHGMGLKYKKMNGLQKNDKWSKLPSGLKENGLY